MTTYPADAIEAALRAMFPGCERPPDYAERIALAIAAFDAAMEAHGWKRVQVASLPDPRNTSAPWQPPIVEKLP